jgi:hypothetical protein
MTELINLTPHPIRIYRPGAPDTVAKVTDHLRWQVEPEALRCAAFDRPYLSVRLEFEVERLRSALDRFGLPALTRWQAATYAALFDGRASYRPPIGGRS